MKSRNMLFTAIIVFLGFHAASAQDMRENVGRSLFSDQKANRVGDAVMIYVVETSSASNDASTATSRESNLGLTGSGNTSSPLPGVSANLGTTNTFKGSGSTAANGSISAKISARVDSVLANGNLYIRGSRTIVINGEEQIIRISGIVRPSDIQQDNSVFSYNISDAMISFQGNGIVSRAQEPGWLTKFFHWIF